MMMIYASRTQRESERRQKARRLSGPCQRAEKTVKHECYSDTNQSWSRALGTFFMNLGKRLCELEIRGRIETVQTAALL